MSAAVVFHSCHPRPDPVMAGVITDLPPLSAAQLIPSQILCEPERFQPIYRTWLENAKAGLTSGMEYSRAIKNRRVRAATVLPALIGARTLARLDEAGASALQQTVKVPRREVRKMIVRAIFTRSGGF